MYSAKEVAEITGLFAATLRYYEKEKLILQITRTDQKYRQYVSLLIQGGKTLGQRYSMVQNHIQEIEMINLHVRFVTELTKRILVGTLCPGAIQTEFASKSKIEDTLLFRLAVMKPEKVAWIVRYCLLSLQIK